MPTPSPSQFGEALRSKVGEYLTSQPGAPAVVVRFRSGSLPALDTVSRPPEEGPVVDLDCDWDDLPLPGHAHLAVLDHVSNHLDLIALRRFLYRAAWLVAPGGQIWIVAHDPDAMRTRIQAANGEPPWPGDQWSGDTLPRNTGAQDTGAQDTGAQDTGAQDTGPRDTGPRDTGPGDTGPQETPPGDARPDRPRREPPAGERYRPLRHYLELSRVLPLRLHTPRELGKGLLLRFTVESPLPRVHGGDATGPDPASDPSQRAEARYGAGSEYRRFDRLEEPEILDDLLFGISRLRTRPGHRVLSLGTNDGRELELFEETGQRDLELWGIDLSESALARARERLPGHAHRLLHADLNTLDQLDLPRFHAVLALNVLHCTTIDRDRLLAQLKPCLTPRARLLISIPNCHFGASDILRRPLDRDHRRHDRSAVLKDLRYLTRYFYRAGFSKIETFGTYDLFLLIRP